MNLIALAIPFFFLLIAVELVWAGKRRGFIYRYQDAITDLGCGIGSQCSGLLLDGALLAVYVLSWERWHVIDWDTGAASTWILAAVLYDHQYYWWHRASHRVNALWAAHVVHHQSEDYNLAVALRQAWFTRLTVWPFYLPLVLLGFPPLVVATTGAINTLYQFWIHTQLVGKLGPLEWFLNTPSHHRVHHGINPAYIDKNHGGILIVWDRLYGTFTEEETEPVYGTVARLRSWDPVWANFKTWVDLLAMAQKTRRVTDKLRVFFAAPEWAPADLGGNKTIPDVDARHYVKWEHAPHPPTNVYIFGQFLVVTAALTSLLFVAKTLPWAVIVAGAAFIVSTTWTWGAMLERRPWARRAELVRLVGVACVAAALVGQRLIGVELAAAATFYVVASAIAALSLRPPPPHELAAPAV